MVSSVFVRATDNDFGYYGLCGVCDIKLDYKMTKKEKRLLSGTGKVENEDGKLRVVFEPGCFDHIDVESQEELDKLMIEIQTMFANMTPEELEAQSRPLTDDDIDAMDPEERTMLMRALEQHDDPTKRRRKLN